MNNATWRVLLTSPSDGPWNMAVDEVLMQHARSTGECVMRVYSWLHPTLSFGRNQAAIGMYDTDRIAEAGISCVRRPTGGRAVLHHREVTYSVVARESGLGSLRESYNRINRLLLHALGILGVGASASNGVGRLANLGPAPCFDQPAAGELVVSGKKLVGSAQWRDDGVLLQHGSILTSDDQSLIPALLVNAVNQESRPATLTEALGREPAWKEVAAALQNAVGTLEDSGVMPLSIDDISTRKLSDAVARYRDDEWTWCR